MMDETLPLTTHEYPEWGNPNDSKEVFDYMLSYDPYFNVSPSLPYPSFLGFYFPLILINFYLINFYI